MDQKQGFVIKIMLHPMQENNNVIRYIVHKHMSNDSPGIAIVKLYLLVQCRPSQIFDHGHITELGFSRSAHKNVVPSKLPKTNPTLLILPEGFQH
jgi:hypothetical protein